MGVFRHSYSGYEWSLKDMLRIVLKDDMGALNMCAGRTI
jgi:hypothetical protein